MSPPVTDEHIELTGVVQGVGMRPFVHRLACELGLDGRVGNDSGTVFIDVTGAPAAVDQLVERLGTEAPPLAHIESVCRRPGITQPPTGFSITPSQSRPGVRTPVPPDTAVCDRCLAELFDPTNRRFRHPFITCTDCGPRLTIITGLPYDRAGTTMAGFEMCPQCRREYTDPTDRRHHAQPIACHDCGPVLTFHSTGTTGDAALDDACAALRAGLIVAVKGLGGYHLAVDATDEIAVAELRRRKHRPDKPLAVMVADLPAARRLAPVSDDEARLLTSPARPIVLLRARPRHGLADGVAPGNPLVGVMLAYTPVHHLLLDAVGRPLVMTSANRSGEPIIHLDDHPALAELAEGLLAHDRAVHVPCDDSVVRVVDGEILPVRRARGYAPVPVAWPDTGRPVLAVGAELKNTCSVASSAHAWVSPHLGDMGTIATQEQFEATEAGFRGLYGVVPDVVAVDAHPDYATTRWARRHHPDRIVEVQHHHAHVAALMAEHGLDPDTRVIGFAFDGTGSGTDGAIWGGEVLVADAHGFERAAHLAYVPLPGGDVAIARPSRVALAHLHAAGVEWTDDLAPVMATPSDERTVLGQQLAGGVACVPTSSMGRLFDAVASLLDVRHHITYEAQAAIELEAMAADAAAGVQAYRFDLDRLGVFDAAPVIRAVVAHRRRGVEAGAIARSFHLAVADLVAELARRSRRATALDTVALTGGVFQNALLTSLCLERLRADGFAPLTHRLVPANDGGLSLGQAYVAAHTGGRG